MLKKLVKHGNTFALTIDKKTLLRAHIDPDTKFELHILPGGGLYIQSVEEIDREKIQSEFDQITAKHDELFKRLKDR